MHTLVTFLLGGWVFLYVGVLIGQLVGSNPQAVPGTAAIMAIPWLIGLVILWAWRARLEKSQ